MAKILIRSSENHKAHFPKLSVFVGQKWILRHYCFQNVNDGIQIRVCKINKENVTCFSQFVSVKVKIMLRKSQAQFREKLRKSKLRQDDCFLIKNCSL